jgi:hypothetical protein
LIDCTEALSNIYGNESQICYPKGKTYRDTQLGELVCSVAVEHTPEHEVVCGSEPAGEKRGEGEIAAEQQPPRASYCEATMSSWEREVAPHPGASNIKVVLRHFHRHCLEQPAVVLCWRGLRSL